MIPERSTHGPAKMIHDYDIEKANRHNFRASLEALARPGEIFFLEPVFDSGLLAMASLLLFGETTFFYKGTEDFELIQATCGAQPASMEEADYIFADQIDLEIMKKAQAGSDENPELGATLLFGVDSLDSQETSVKISGPGINGNKALLLPAATPFIELRQKKNSQFPLGVDIYLIGPDSSLLGLPRTTRIEVMR